MSDYDTHELPAEGRIFGFEPSPLTLTVRPRSTAWRATRLGAFAGAGLLASPVVALAPPHVAWALASVLTGGFLGWRKWVERFTLLEVSGHCPKCDTLQELGSPIRLQRRFVLGCPGCQHDVQVVLPETASV